ncbi:MAG: ATP-binding protein, partial [Deltaproteobacteria bacterium]|nr:ATP-binding protein [Deltaproteobacteria bacterium]
MNDLPNNAADSGDSDQGATKVTLPIGAADFRLIREFGLYYADKTKFLYPIVQVPLPYFLSRPRRFGKSLLLETLESILRGQRELFQGLWIDQSDYHWTPYPVIRLEMNNVVENDVVTMEETLSRNLATIAKNEGVENLEKNSPKNMLGDLIDSLYQDTHQKVAILIDEYDAPIVEYLADPDKANEFRVALRRFYGILKTNVKAIGHIFVTGVSRFTQSYIFSELNILRDLTFSSKFAAICGLTAADLEDLLSDREGEILADLIEKGFLPPESDGHDLRNLIRVWYDGYSWDGETRVYNPWAILNFFVKAKVSRHWFESGSPSFWRDQGESGLVNFNLELPKSPPKFDLRWMAIHDIAHMDPAVSLFQTGYLTVKEIQLNPDKGVEEYILGYPNLEVSSILAPLALSLKPLENELLAYKLAIRTRDSLLSLDLEGLMEALGGYLSQYPDDDHIEAEKYYSTLFQSALLMSGQWFQTQKHTTHGRLDIHVKGPKCDDYIVEIKFYNEEKPQNASLRPPRDAAGKAQLREAMEPLAEKALTQIKEKYLANFEGGDNRVILVALVIARRNFVLAK